MSRIRSIHPGIFTDEAWVSVSFGARLLGLGLLTEADDSGIFEWKVIQLKMKIFPVDHVDVADLLEELANAEIVLKFLAQGKWYGALRNFAKYQRPRKPKSWFPTTPEVRIFAALDDRGSEASQSESDGGTQKSELEGDERQPVPQNAEKPPQMEDGGWRMEDGEREEPFPDRADLSEGTSGSTVIPLRERAA